MYPATEPYQSGMLDVGDGNRIYWETCGNPTGVPALALHGGPGSGCVPGMRQPFNPKKYRVVLFDQRGCGRSTPHASNPAVDLGANTTDHLIADIERLRTYLGVDRWVLAGWSWGTTLALAYAEQYPERVTALVLTAVTTTSPHEVRWITRDVGRLFPAEWSRFRDGLPEADRDGDLVAAYARLLNHPDPAVREKAARDWCEWEENHVNLGPVRRPNPQYSDPLFRMCFARLVTHYWLHGAWRAEGELLGNVSKIAHIPAALIHGRLDLSSPPDIPWQLAQRWSAAQLHIVAEAGHAAGGAMSDRGVDALDRFAEAP
ncbi:proline iminopeptidase [Mycobacterium haemophilum DSM 44634]|uniref:Proline iminopeptidase n=1 Tax=Mycobacterium haemophilum TaxID=29311 RepID=A0A0I9U5R2_9MYCO|nr:prolyl aminopeptidase [Mycobacterium haemophilum]AKN18625.1 proline iminopeptidase [Mycobacterium haemophilum DSM 44634]KLO32094.1 proline iminopeptidase [Mycobacterium haemophilum]KLO36443.1 proline iminopeptidase [Mycobacterium haemophilum]KLO42328.1 proline iminopeptidase [Mycobacterium haemophilum]KLO50130.1 proline iminopeptidase [Mycobacterium haemophilum]